MKGNEIIVCADPQGQFLEGIIEGTPKPGTCMELKPATALDGGARPTYRAVTRASGAKGPIFILLADSMQGKTASDAYVTGTRGFLYAPIAGESFNMRLGDVSGTGDTVAIGDLFGVETVTGELIRDSSYASTPFQAREALAALTADAHLWVEYLGNNA